MRRVTAAAHPNLALVKYWGRTDPLRNLPSNDSISVNLDGATTTTTVTFDPALARDELTLNGRAAERTAFARVAAHLDRVRALAGIETCVAVVSQNDYPAAAGIASSAAAFAALSLAATRAAGLDLTERELSVLARKGSGSASRSIPDGFAEWRAAPRDADSYAHSLAPCNHWDLRIATVYFGDRPKEVSSLEGHAAAPASPFYRARLAALPERPPGGREALRARDLSTLGMAAEREAVELHVIAMTSRPAKRPWLSGIYYWQPETVALIRLVQQWREAGLPLYFTLDAGPSVHLICEGKELLRVQDALALHLPALGAEVIVSRPGRGAWIVADPGAPPRPHDPSCTR